MYTQVTCWTRQITLDKLPTWWPLASGDNIRLRLFFTSGKFRANAQFKNSKGSFEMKLKNRHDDLKPAVALVGWQFVLLSSPCVSAAWRIKKFITNHRMVFLFLKTCVTAKPHRSEAVLISRLHLTSTHFVERPQIGTVSITVRQEIWKAEKWEWRRTDLSVFFLSGSEYYMIQKSMIDLYEYMYT